MGDTLLFYSQGFPVGEVGTDGKYYVNNHVHMVVDYHPMVLGDVSRCNATAAVPTSEPLFVSCFM